MLLRCDLVELKGLLGLAEAQHRPHEIEITEVETTGRADDEDAAGANLDLHDGVGVGGVCKALRGESVCLGSTCPGDGNDQSRAIRNARVSSHTAVNCLQRNNSINVH
jgi:hypothetical protein